MRLALLILAIATLPLACPPAFGAASDGRWGWTSTQSVGAADLRGLSKHDLEIMRNEIYARHGWVFARPDLRAYFEGQSWYRPLPGPRDQANRTADRQLSALERRNIAAIKRQEAR